VERLTRGDAQAFTQLHSRYEMTLYAEAFRLLLDPADATAVVESVFVDLVGSAASLLPPLASDSIHRWLLQRTRSLARATLATRGMRDPIISPSIIPA
jgi:DNA-directed RNA polymerase specialized sigma24 family protein